MCGKATGRATPSTGSRTPACDFPQRRQSGVEKGGLCGTGGLSEGLRRCGLAEIPVCGSAGVGQRFERWALRGRRAVRRTVVLWAGRGFPADETETGGKDMDKTKREVSRFEWDERTAPRLIRNEELICRDCRHRSEKSGICGKYPQGKPGSVFNSQRWCGEYSPESE